MLDQRLSTLFESMPDLTVRRAVPLSQISRWRIGGPADWVVAPSDPSQVAALIRSLQRLAIPWMTMGHSSNLLFNDEGIRGVLILIAENLSDCEIDGQNVKVQAGHWVPHLAYRLMKEGLAGGEHIVGIPGTIGGLICMNGGSMRRGIGEHVVSVSCVNPDGNEQHLSHADCDFRYRGSAIQDHRLTVVEAFLAFERGESPTIRREMKSILKSRRLKFPLKVPNCGSVFISDPAMYEQFGPPGAVIERCGLKGFVYGDAQISPDHANFIINRGRATANDVLQLIHHIRGIAQEQFGCELRCEVRHVDPRCGVLPAHLVPRPPQRKAS